MNINKIRQRPESVSSKTPHRSAAYRPSLAFNSPGSPTRNPEISKYINFFKTNEASGLKGKYFYGHQKKGGPRCH